MALETAVFWKFCKNMQKYYMTEFTVKEVQYLESPLSWMKRSAKYNFLGIYEIFNITSNSTNLDCQMQFQ